MPQTLSLVFNAIGLCSNVYALRNMNSAAFENPYALGFGGQYQVRTSANHQRTHKPKLTK